MMMRLPEPLPTFPAAETRPPALALTALPRSKSPDPWLKSMARSGLWPCHVWPRHSCWHVKGTLSSGRVPAASALTALTAVPAPTAASVARATAVRFIRVDMFMTLTPSFPGGPPGLVPRRLDRADEKGAGAWGDGCRPTARGARG